MSLNSRLKSNKNLFLTLLGADFKLHNDRDAHIGATWPE